jgi:hypothetical protein
MLVCINLEESQDLRIILLSSLLSALECAISDI